MEPHQFLPQFLQLPDSAETAVNGTDAPAGTIQLSGNDNLSVIGVNALFFQFFDNGAVGVENTFYLEKISTGTDKVRAGPAAGEHGQSIDEDRFSRPCFPRKYGDTLVKINDCIFNNSEIDNMKALQHSGSPPQDLSMPWIWDRSTGTSSGVFRMMRTVSSPARVPMMTSFLEWSMAKATEEAEPGMV